MRRPCVPQDGQAGSLEPVHHGPAFFLKKIAQPNCFELLINLICNTHSGCIFASHNFGHSAVTQLKNRQMQCEVK